MPDVEEGDGAEVGRASHQSADRKESATYILLPQNIPTHPCDRYRIIVEVEPSKPEGDQYFHQLRVRKILSLYPRS